MQKCSINKKTCHLTDVGFTSSWFFKNRTVKAFFINHVASKKNQISMRHKVNWKKGKQESYTSMCCIVFIARLWIYFASKAFTSYTFRVYFGRIDKFPAKLDVKNTFSQKCAYYLQLCAHELVTWQVDFFFSHVCSEKHQNGYTRRYVRTKKAFENSLFIGIGWNYVEAPPCNCILW